MGPVGTATIPWILIIIIRPFSSNCTFEDKLKLHYPFCAAYRPVEHKKKTCGEHNLVCAFVLGLPYVTGMEISSE